MTHLANTVFGSRTPRHMVDWVLAPGRRTQEPGGAASSAHAPLGTVDFDLLTLSHLGPHDLLQVRTVSKALRGRAELLYVWKNSVDKYILASPQQPPPKRWSFKHAVGFSLAMYAICVGVTGGGILPFLPFAKPLMPRYPAPSPLPQEPVEDCSGHGLEDYPQCAPYLAATQLCSFPNVYLPPFALCVTPEGYSCFEAGFAACVRRSAYDHFAWESKAQEHSNAERKARDEADERCDNANAGRSMVRIAAPIACLILGFPFVNMLEAFREEREAEASRQEAEQQAERRTLMEALTGRKRSPRSWVSPNEVRALVRAERDSSSERRKC